VNFINQNNKKVRNKMSAKAEKIKDILLELEKNSEVDNSALVSLKGQMMASALHRDIDERALAAMTAALTSVGTRVGDTLNSGKTGSIVINGSNKLIVLNQLTQAVLIALAPAEAKIGLIDFEINSALDKIKMVLG
jgi:predicted regulator of Ras-like GTPase activity (Roadblock/LC7/MglB family)